MYPRAICLCGCGAAAHDGPNLDGPCSECECTGAVYDSREPDAPSQASGGEGEVSEPSPAARELFADGGDDDAHACPDCGMDRRPEPPLTKKSLEKKWRVFRWGFNWHAWTYPEVLRDGRHVGAIVDLGATRDTTEEEAWVVFVTLANALRAVSA